MTITPGEGGRERGREGGKEESRVFPEIPGEGGREGSRAPQESSLSVLISYRRLHVLLSTLDVSLEPIAAFVPPPQG
jgi:hypothetical protein